MGTADGAGLPGSVDLAWGFRTQPGKGPKRTLTLEQIVDAAARVGAAEGLAAVSMSRVAAEAGVSTMALYRYVASKADLLELMTDHVLGPPPALPGPEAGWRAGMAAWAWAMRAALVRHPWLLGVPITGPPVMPNTVAWMEAGLSRLRATGLGPGAKVSILTLLGGHVRSQAILFRDMAASLDDAGTTEAEMLTGYGALLARVADPGRFPELHRLLGEGVFDMGDAPGAEADPADAEFAFGLDRILDGVQVLVDREAAVHEQ
ncbi:TetR/AcrR family transcriptional regulator [Actinomadura hibisca]|uniref:TetR/AcrR family transcriptional regulator n=1 Tax=Actinomadura hibisca TaxID=68565 RepID=UPI00082A9C89|nr:TetR/AcrR family transcriptional regulator [Actinomadura hibisca]